MTDNITSFADLALIEPLLRALKGENYATPTPIQAQAIPHLLAGRDLVGCAQTGTGKTAAFALPILQRLAKERRPAAAKGARALVLAPTRELALQIGESFRSYGRHLGLSHAVIFGGVGQQPQVGAMARGVQVLVATPGRLLDLINQRHLSLAGVEVFVLDEADRMLDMGFINDVRKIVAMLPRERQTLLFSATMPPAIAELAKRMLRDPAEVAVTPVASTVERIDQRVLHVSGDRKAPLLIDILRDPAVTRALVFTRTKHRANKVVRDLDRARIAADAIHGNKSQSARQRALADFRNGKCRVLVATDIAARGIDVDGVTHVINFDLPNEPESYVHRIGRTARAGASGVAISFCDGQERSYLRDIERLTRQRIFVTPTPEISAAAVAETAARPLLPGKPQSGEHGHAARHNAGRPADRHAAGRPTGQPRRFGRNRRKPAGHTGGGRHAAASAVGQ
ncbi:MAG TPA: DEAD/DEAH box helicase [Candidatus Sulfotelmatobacter sp.]|nr:DEAD/DEAH box helicase [Candidatus Sulfotelmatobacter sp.]